MTKYAVVRYGTGEEMIGEASPSLVAASLAAGPEGAVRATLTLTEPATLVWEPDTDGHATVYVAEA